MVDPSESAPPIMSQYRRTGIPGLYLQPDLIKDYRLQVKHWDDATEVDDDAMIANQLDSTFDPGDDRSFFINEQTPFAGILVEPNRMKGVVVIDAKGVVVDAETGLKKNIFMRIEDEAAEEGRAHQASSQEVAMPSRQDAALTGRKRKDRFEQRGISEAMEADLYGESSEVAKGKRRQDPPDDDTNDKITLHARKHNHSIGRLVVSKMASDLRFIPNKGKILDFQVDPDSLIHMYSFSHGSTFRFINCGVGVSIDAAPGARNWTGRDDCMIHALFSDTQGGAKTSGGHPSPNDEHARENSKVEREFVARLKEIAGDKFEEVAGRVEDNELDAKIRLTEEEGN